MLWKHRYYVASIGKPSLIFVGAGEGDDRGWDGWMAWLTWWTWVWVNSGSWWWTGRPGVLRFMGLQRVRHDWATEMNWTELNLVLVINTYGYWFLASLKESCFPLLPSFVRRMKNHEMRISICFMYWELGLVTSEDSPSGSCHWGVQVVCQACISSQPAGSLRTWSDRQHSLCPTMPAFRGVWIKYPSP